MPSGIYPRIKGIHGRPKNQNAAGKHSVRWNHPSHYRTGNTAAMIKDKLDVAQIYTVSTQRRMSGCNSDERIDIMEAMG